MIKFHRSDYNFLKKKLLPKIIRPTCMSSDPIFSFSKKDLSNGKIRVPYYMDIGLMSLFNFDRRQLRYLMDVFVYA